MLQPAKAFCTGGRRQLAGPEWVTGCREDGLPATDGLPLTADAPLQRGEMAKSAISGHGDQFLLQGHASERVKEQRLFGVSKAEQASLYRLALKSQTFPYRGEPRLSGQ